MPKVTVIIPNYNHAQYLSKRIDSVLNQTYQDFEVIILDDCSSDSSKLIIENYRGHPKIKSIVYNKVNSGGVYYQWKKGIAMAECDFIWIAESDDYAEPEFLMQLLQPFEKYPNLGISFCNSNWVDDKGEVGESLSSYNESFYKNGIMEIKEKLLTVNTIQNVSAVIIKREYAEIGLKKISKFKSCGDWFLYISILKNTDLYYNNEKLNNFRWYHNNTSNKANKSGLWILEGTKLLRMIKQKEIRLIQSEFNYVYHFWKWKIMNFGFPSFSKRKLSSSINLFIFYIRYQLIKYSNKIIKRNYES